MSPTPETSSSVRPTISHYEILAPLGKGGMGEVYVAFDTTLHRKVALKAVRQDRQLNDEGRARLLREAQMLSQLDHAGICRVFDYVSDGGNDYLVMELIEGRSLREAMKESLPRAAGMRIAEQVAQALAVAHAAGIVHRDLKPENVMLLPDGSAKVLDFGLARPFDAPLPIARASTSSRLPHNIGAQFDSDGETLAATASSAAPFGADSPVNTVHGVLMGTPAYMSPEQAAGEPATAPSDMYAFGQTYRVALSICCSWDLVDVSFVMTTSIISGPVLLPPQCSMFSPVSDWICVGEAWVPPGHSAAEGVVTFPQPAPLIVIPPPPPPTGGAPGCPTIRPGPDWVCVTGNWLPSDHPDALSAPANPTPQPPPPLAPTGCTTPDPFAGIPGMIGVCIGNNIWVPLGHPLAGGGG